MKLRIHDQELDLRQGRGTLTLDGRPVPFTLTHRRRHGDTWEIAGMLGDRPVRYFVTPQPDGSWLAAAPGGLAASAAPAGAARPTVGPHGPIRTPMAGVVTALHVEAGQHVEAGAPLAVVEAMKMRYTLTAEAEGRVETVLVAERALVTAGQVLLHLGEA